MITHTIPAAILYAGSSFPAHHEGVKSKEIIAAQSIQITPVHANESLMNHFTILLNIFFIFQDFFMHNQYNYASILYPEK